MKLLVINGPSINMLGIREKEIYGEKSYKELCSFIKEISKANNAKTKIYQSNSEGKIIDAIQRAYFKKVDGIIINPGAYTHYSYAIRDAIKAVNIKTIEVHLSDISSREDFRKVSVISDVCVKTISGKGFDSYKEAIELLVNGPKGLKIKKHIEKILK